MKVLWLANIPSPYSVHFFNELGKLCDLTILFELDGANDRDDSWRVFRFETFRGVQLKGIRYSTDKAFCPGVRKHLRGKYDVIVVSNMATLTGIAAITYMKRKKITYIIQGDGGFRKNQKGFKEKLKTYLISGAKYCLGTGKEHDEYYIAYGAKPDRIFRIPFTSVHEKDLLAKPTPLAEKRELRVERHLHGEKIILSVGQFIYRKGYDVLLAAAKELDDTVGFYIVGGKPTEEYLSLVKEYQLKNVTFLDYMSPVDLRAYYRAADMFVLPTREDIWGLVINEAMSQALPVVTTDGCIAGLELVENGKNGYIVQTEDSDSLAEAIRKVLTAEDYNELCKASLEKIQGYTIENTANVHFEIFKKIIGESKE